jgi:lipopolysaccharide/colanic/teichoic acid biosynthesis glycosyltransferase
MGAGFLAMDAHCGATMEAQSAQSRECRPARGMAISPYLDSRAKRMIELILTLVLLAAALPLCLLIGMAILVTDGWPVLFAQRRAGRNGRPFTLWKFRTLRLAAEADEYAAESELLPRYTRIGGFLRRRKLDELPQLLAVLTGVMSLVGPRPERIPIARCYSPGEGRRLRCKPGVTGLWQVLADRTQPIHRQMKYDLCYLRRASLLLDLRILAMTAVVMLSPSRLEGKQP